MNEIRTTKDGKEINLKDMTEEHIINCIKKIERDGLIVKEIYCGGYAGEDGDVEIYRDERKERERLIKFYEELLRRLKEENKNLKEDLEKFSEAYKRYRDYEKEELAESCYDLARENQKLKAKLEEYVKEYENLPF